MINRAINFDNAVSIKESKKLGNQNAQKTFYIIEEIDNKINGSNEE